MDDPSQMRISDSDRHKVAEVLREAAGEGRLDFDELDDRLEATYAAKTYGDLVPITLDLPAKGLDLVPPTGLEPRDAAPVSVSAPRYNSSFVIMGGQDRKGIWEVGETHTAFSLMGGINIDLRQAIFTAPETTIHVYAFMSGVDVVVNEHAKVIVGGIGIMGAFDGVRDKVPPRITADAPVVRIKGLALMGGVGVVRKAMPGEGRSSRRKKIDPGSG